MDIRAEKPRLSVLDLETARNRLELPDAVFMEFIRLTIQDIAAAMTALRTLTESGDREQVVHLAHTVKGAASGIGAEKLAEAARRLESVARSGGAGRWGEDLRFLEVERDRMEKAFESKAENHTGGG